ncbi:MAG: hypothetical protein U0790_07295 [Isosphaeraceae bacterium]
MSGCFSLPKPYGDDAEAYCDGLIGPEEFARLEAYLRENEEARRAFVAGFQLHTEIHFAVRARRAADAVLDRVLAGEPPEVESPRTAAEGRARLRWRWRRVVAALALLGMAGLAGFAILSGRLSREALAPATEHATERREGNVAWLVNAQDCRWAGAASEMPGRDMRAGKVLRLRRGLADIEFECGAHVLLQGPADLVLIGGTTARLIRGTLTARVPEQARGFTILSPGGKVVDLGTEFGLSVDAEGATTVKVFRGVVAAFPLGAGERPYPAIRLSEDEAARIDGRSVDLVREGPGSTPLRFVRAIQPPPVITPRSLRLDFSRTVPGSILDLEGRGIGLTHRLPGTGGDLPDRDPNLALLPAEGSLRLTTTRSDLNTQDRMPTGEYLGLRLRELGFTGSEDFEISTTIPRIPGLKQVGQFGLYVGASSVACIRGGLISWPEPDRYGLFLVNNSGGVDSDLNEIGLMSTGDDLRLTLRRLAKRYSLVVENLTRGSSSTLTITHPAFLDGESDLFAGLFGANPQTDVSRTLTIKEVRCTIWTRQGNEPARTP